MKSLLKQSPFFILLLIVNVAVVEHFLSPIVNYGEISIKYDEILKPVQNADILILGNSTAEEGIIPNVISYKDMKSFNFAESGSAPTYFRRWYPQVLKRYYKKPKVVLYCAHWNMFYANSRKFEHSSGCFPAGLMLKELFNPAAEKIELLMNYFSIIKCGNINIGENLAFYISNNNQLKKYLGFISKGPGMGMTAEDYKNGFKNPLYDRVLEPAELDAFKQLIDEMKADGIEVIFVILPNFWPYLYDWDKQSLSRFKDVFYKIAQERKIHVLDYNPVRNSDVNANKELFHDTIHLNSNGAVYFSQLLNFDLKNILDQKEARKTNR